MNARMDGPFLICHPNPFRGIKTNLPKYLDTSIHVFFAKLLDSYKPNHFFDQQAGTSLKLLVIVNVMSEQTDTLSIFYENFKHLSFSE